MITTVEVSVPGGTYPIHIGSELLAREDCFAPALGPKNIVVTDNRVGPLYLEKLNRGCRDRIDAVITLAEGENSKTLANAEHVIDVLTANQCSRDATLIALGGGVIGDLTGFAAAIYQRGISFVQVPTTLLAQVDSAVGGKTAVNHSQGKNLVGAFHQPRAVITDLDTLQTLDPRHGRAGLAEVIKYGMLADAAFFDWLENNLTAVRAHDNTALQYLVRRCCEIKARVVAEDEREHGSRALLNLGHTFAHAIESETKYQWLHGEAVAAGLVLAARLSRELGLVDHDTVRRVQQLVTAAGLPASPPDMSIESWMRWMQMDKKVRDGAMRFVLIDNIGSARLDSNVDPAALRSVLGSTSEHG